MSRVLKTDIAGVEAARALVERETRGLANPSPAIRALAQAKQVRDDIYAPDAFEAIVEDDEDVAS